MSTNNPINSILQQFDKQQTPTAPATPAALPTSAPMAPAPAAPGTPAAAAGGSNPVNEILMKFDSGTSPEISALPPVPSVTSQPRSDRPVNPVSDILKSFDVRSYSSLSPDELKQSTRPDPENQIEEPWWSKTWDWMQKPLWDFHQYGTRTGAGAFERGIESGGEDILSGLFSPLNLALTVATFSGAAVRSVKALLAADKKAEGAPNVPGTRPKNS